MEVTVEGIQIDYCAPDSYEEVPEGTPGARVFHVGVAHDTTWNIYTDTGFEKAISDVLGFDVAFTEAGMQQDESASMECTLEPECACYGCTTMRHACIDEILN
jgi:hypothetical protein